MDKLFISTRLGGTQKILIFIRPIYVHIYSLAYNRTEKNIYYNRTEKNIYFMQNLPEIKLFI